MEGTGARKLKKAVVSLQKLDMSFQGSSFLSREMLTNSGGSENPPVDSIGCTDDDDLEKKIQAFSIPVKPDELPVLTSKSFKKPHGKDSITVGKKLTEFKSDKPQPSSSTSTKDKDKVSHGKISSETEKQRSKTVSDQEKLSQGKIAKDKVSSDLRKISTTKDQDVKKLKSEQEKSSKTRQDDAVSKEKSLKRKSSIDHKSREPQEKLIKFEKKEKQSEREKPSSTKSNSSHSKSVDSKGHIKTVPLKKVTKHDESKSGSDKVKVNKEAKEERRESQKIKEGVKEVKKTNKDLKKDDKTVQSTTSKVTDSKSVAKNNEKSVLSDAKKRPILRRQSSSNSLIEKKMKLKVHSQSFSESNKKDIKKEVGNGKVVPKRVASEVNKKEGKVVKKIVSSDRNGKRKDVKEKTGRNDTENQTKNGKVIKKTLSTNSFHLKKVSRSTLELKSSSHKFEKSEGQKKFDKKKHGSERNEKSRERKEEGAAKQKRNHKKLAGSSGKQKAVINDSENILNYEEDEVKPDFHLTGRFLLSKPLFKTFSEKSDRFPSQNVGTEAYKKIWKWSHYIRMPSDKWSLHKHPKGDYVIILHVSEITPLHKIIIDKHVLFCKTALPVVKLYDKEVSTLQTAKELLTLGEVCAFLKNIDNLSVCESLRKSIVVGSNGKCGLYTSSKVTLPYTCQHCSRMKASSI